MLEQALKQQVQTLLAGLNSSYIFSIKTRPEDSNGKIMIDFLSEVASCSEQISIQVEEGDLPEFTILKNGEPTSIKFRAVPSGHEFSTLLLLILNLDGKGKNFPDEQVQSRIRNLRGEINLSSFISLSCTNCPDVVQSLNLIAILNPRVHHQIIDGAINRDLAEQKNIQAVPSLFAEDELLHVGRGSLGELLEKLEKHYGSEQPSGEIAVSHQDVVVIGGGPAGTAAAIYAARKGQRVAIVADAIGGQVLETTGIENLISVPRTTGRQLGNDLKGHLKEYPVHILENRKVMSLQIEEGKKAVITSSGEKLLADAVIIATGASWRRLNVPGEKEHIGAGIAFCTHCDGPLYKAKRVVVVGGGNSGLEAAIDLSAIASHVTVLEYLPQLKGDNVLQEKLHSLTNVTVQTSVAVQEVIGNGKTVTAIRYKERNSDQEQTLTTDGVFVQIGLSANSAFAKDLVETTPQGEIRIDAFCRTNVPGIYAAGDVSTVPYKQIIIAMGEGAKAALSAFEDSLKGQLSY